MKLQVVMLLIAISVVATSKPVQAQSPGNTSVNKSMPSSGPAEAGASRDDYRLGVADKVRVIVFGEPTLSGEFIVNANGALSMPLIGDVQARDATATEVAQTIRTRLLDGYVREPRVSIDVLTFRPFYILGEVNKPGEYPYSNGLTVYNAVATAQGFTYRADKKRVFLKHAGEVNAISQALTPDLKVRPGDTIRIGERYF